MVPRICGQGAWDALHPVADDHRGIDGRGAGEHTRVMAVML